MEIIINNLSKRYGKKEVLRNISLTIPEGMYGLLGRNGAGKTSFMRILATLSIPTNGDIQMNGVSIKETTKVREMIGYLPQDFSIYKNMTVFGALDYLGLLSNLPNKIRKERIYTLLEQVHLKDNAKTKVKALSGGMKRRLGIAQALLHNPQILIVDEPTAGLDPEERIRFRNLLSDFSDGRIVILSTHIASDIESTCQNVAVLNKGNILFHGSTETLRKQADHKVYLITVPKSLDKPIKEHYYVLNRNSTNTGIQYRILSNTPPNELAEIQTPTLEDGYMYLLQQAEGES
ncbi:MAG TPA: ABC transporter ATP-binding protein [Candidatus Fimimorpha faecalis]|uniref:ABC transporter ATP-binding protein n=1 Tax=Candidatus Fimimorpha faecalis TaxID=2840824 RepID=A0A9D1JCZ5_9FIRM|nr:ABC transporter ATP-binding protein [Candidatus Fimimorpha faecalis]